METREIFFTIESAEFAARINLANNVHELFLLLKEEASVKDLLLSCEQPDVRTLLAEKTIRLLERSVDLRYENPNDTAIAVYLWAISLHLSPAMEYLSSRIFSLPNMWWARKIARSISGHETIRTIAASAWDAIAPEATTTDDCDAASESVSIATAHYTPSTQVLWLSEGGFKQQGALVANLDLNEENQFSLASSAGESR